MEFDLDGFMSEVDDALRYRSPPAHSHTRKNSRSRGTTNDEVPQFPGSLSVSCPEISYPLSKRARLSSTSPPRGIEASQRRPSTASSNDNTGLEFEEENSHDISNILHPSLDMSTALVSARAKIPPSLPSDRLELRNSNSIDTSLISMERLDLVPKFYAYSVKSCLLPLRRVQHELITLYFHHVHPMFPVVDEYHITELHRKYYGQEELMDPSDFIVYHAVMVVGFAHLSEAQVRNTPYRSVPEGQEAQVDQLKAGHVIRSALNLSNQFFQARYWSQTTTDPVVLTQISLLLSLWSPGWIGAQNNSYWLDMAFKHAAAKRLWEHDPEESNNSRLRLLWWCCLVRDRVLALGMRRPHRLHKALLEDDIVSKSDFGVEAKYPSYTDFKSKQVEILAFIWFCRLSRIMETIAIVQRQNRFVRDWNGDNVENITSELEEVISLQEKLDTWLKEYEIAVSEATAGDESDGNLPIHISTLRIMVHSLRATLYQPYLHLSVDYPALVEVGIDPLQRMKDGAREVAAHVRDVMWNKKSDAIPTWLVAWVTLPVAVYHVNQRIRLNSPPDQVLMPFLAQLVRRTSGALMLLMLVRSATKDHIEAITNGEDQDDTSVTAPSKGTTKFRFIHSTLSRNVVTRGTEARLLAFVTKAIDSALELNGMSQDHQPAPP